MQFWLSIVTYPVCPRWLRGMSLVSRVRLCRPVCRVSICYRRLLARVPRR